ncbi:SAM-dependent methyltransferase [Polyangium sorediatum]|uniref:SAM-dependent methyltransferase n=1 Tax=Polyangium sorediatum TaxID=889274 RepID=A0ABT6P932_9BACT|nr:SAM-dependent methyltransferase [Polyangium sorediatum]MDI1437130.1 SAM-dependent methyltransferase [Polyangium sorediatum]
MRASASGRGMEEWMLEGNGSLVVVGTGIRTTEHLTGNAIAWIKASDKVLYVVADLVAERVIKELSPSAESLTALYGEGKPRGETYHAMVDRILDAVRGGHRTCVVLYGHPGVFAYPGHLAIERARDEGYPATMLPAISAEDCLFADLGIDPGHQGMQSYEATHFVLHRKRIDPTTALVLWQIGSFGDNTYRREGASNHRLPFLVARLCEEYPADHAVTIYEAAIYIGCAPRIERLRLGKLAEARVTPASTLYIPPVRKSRIDSATAAWLGFEPADR